MVNIENELLKVSANELGGSLTSIYDKKKILNFFINR